MRALRLALLACAAACLAMGVAGGLARLGFRIFVPREMTYHGLLMVSGFLGTVISIERAVAHGSAWTYAAPAASLLGVALLLAGWTAEASVLFLEAPLLFAVVTGALLRRQPQAHLAVMLVGAGCWTVANALAFAGGVPNAIAAWWFAFLVLTIAAERLEMTRLLPRRAFAAPLFHAACAVLVAGAALSIVAPPWGAALFGLGLVAIAAWLAAFDIARRTVRTHGFARYAATALLAGYVWLAVGGVAWGLMGQRSIPWRDVALHAVGLGFVFSMILAHAPLIVPIIAKLRMNYVPALYVPLVVLHASVALRIASDLAMPALRPWSGVANAAALVAFAATLVVTLRRNTSMERSPEVTC